MDVTADRASHSLIVPRCLTGRLELGILLGMFQVHWRVWLPFVLPYAIYVLMTSLEPYFPSAYPILYGIKFVVVAAVIALLWKGLPLQKFPSARWVGVAVISGIILTAMWVGIDPLVRHAGPSHDRIGFNPYSIHNVADRTAFLAVRIAGLALLVPVLEEALYRGFLLRVVVDQEDFRTVPIGVVTWLGLAVNIIMFTLSHPEHVVAALFSAAMCGLIWKSKNLWVPIIAHGVTNLGLAMFILQTHKWWYW